MKTPTPSPTPAADLAAVLTRVPQSMRLDPGFIDSLRRLQLHCDGSAERELVNCQRRLDELAGENANLRRIVANYERTAGAAAETVAADPAAVVTGSPETESQTGDSAERATIGDGSRSS